MVVWFLVIIYHCDIQGGMKAVVWTDCFQIVVMFAGMLTLLISGSIKLGGLDVAWDHTTLYVTMINNNKKSYHPVCHNDKQ
jgi:Na+/proline symporter